MLKKTKVIIPLIFVTILLLLWYLCANFSVLHVDNGIMFFKTNVEKFENANGLEYVINYSIELNKFKNIKSISINANSCTDLYFLSNMNELQTVRLFFFDEYEPQLLNTIPYLEKLNNLQIVGNYSNSFFLNSDKFHNFNNIQSLLIQNFNSASLDFIENFENLKELKLYISNICCLKDLSNLYYLESLTLSFNQDITSLNVSELSKCCRLHNLNIISNVKGKAKLNDTLSFSYLNTVKKITLKNVIINDITGFIKMSSLETLNITNHCINKEQEKKLNDFGIKVNYL